MLDHVYEEYHTVLNGGKERIRTEKHAIPETTESEWDVKARGL